MSTDSIIFEYLPQDKILQSTWLTGAYMSEEAYKKVVLSYVDALLKYRPKHSLLDTREASFTISPRIQTWLIQTIKPVYKQISLERTAFITSHDFYVQLAVEQIVEDGDQNELNVKRGFFNSQAEAINWLRKDSV